MYNSLSAGIFPLSMVFSSPSFRFHSNQPPRRRDHYLAFAGPDASLFLGPCSLGPGLAFKILPGMDGHDRRDLYLAIDESCHYPSSTTFGSLSKATLLLLICIMRWITRVLSSRLNVHNTSHLMRCRLHASTGAATPALKRLTTLKLATIHTHGMSS